MENKNLSFRLLDQSYIEAMLELTKQLNPNTDLAVLKERHHQMFKFASYQCFGLFEDQKLIGVSSAWITVRLYSGKQLEIDNLIVDGSVQSKGFGHYFIQKIENWAKAHDCETTELNTYVQNGRSHKFYYNQGYQILGFHFLKKLAGKSSSVQNSCDES